MRILYSIGILSFLLGGQRAQAVELPATACDLLESSASVRDIIGLVRDSATVRVPLWTDYSPSQQVYALTGKNDLGICVLVYDKPNLTGRIELATPITFENELYDFYNEGQASALPEKLQSYFQAAGIKVATIIDAGVDFWASSEYKPYQTFLLGVSGFVPETLIHEAFHHVGQRAGTNWPEWASAVHRDQIDPECYRATDEIKALYQREAQALIAAFQLTTQYHKMDLAKQAAQVFIDTRKVRYQRLQDLPPPASGNKLDCPQTEAALEMVEGTAQYIGLGYQLLTGRLDHLRLQARLTAEIDYDSNYYNFGALQLLILRELNVAAMTDITSQLANSPDWEHNIHRVFTQAFATP